MTTQLLLPALEAADARYREIGCAYWRLAVKSKYDPIGRELVRGHYSRRKPDAPQFMPPGEVFVLVSRCETAVWGWWRPHPAAGLPSMNGYDGWTCSVFANHGDTLSSLLVLDAERALVQLEQLDLVAAPCGPSGMLTYVWRRRVKSPNPGYCYKMAGWKKIGTCKKGSKDLLHKPMTEAGQAPATSARASAAPCATRATTG